MKIEPFRMFYLNTYQHIQSISKVYVALFNYIITNMSIGLLYRRYMVRINNFKVSIILLKTPRKVLQDLESVSKDSQRLGKYHREF